MDTLTNILKQVQLPELIHVKQKFKRQVVSDIKKQLINKFSQKQIFRLLKPEQRIAIAVGSREISNELTVIKILIHELKKHGIKPFIVPAMGSHGGATAEGQKKILNSMGINEKTTGVPIISSMGVVKTGKTDSGLPVFADREAYNSDGIILINRIKHHTSFSGPYESGLCKMIAIGLGKQKGAETCHNAGFSAMSGNIPEVAKETIRKTNIVFGIALIENAYHETASVHVLTKDEIIKEEPALLEQAKDLSAKLYFNSIDVLVIEEAGKNISGTGFDLKLAGRVDTCTVSTDNSGKNYPGTYPSVKRIAVLDLTDASHGNCNGIGLADFITKRYFEKIDFNQTYPNSLTTADPARAKIPMVLDNDRLTIQAAVKTCNIRNKNHIKLIGIKNTLLLDDLYISPAAVSSITDASNVALLERGLHFKFDSNGNLV